VPKSGEIERPKSVETPPVEPPTVQPPKGEAPKLEPPKTLTAPSKPESITPIAPADRM
jgi:hypothetical protein